MITGRVKFGMLCTPVTGLPGDYCALTLAVETCAACVMLMAHICILVLPNKFADTNVHADMPQGTNFISDHITPK